MPRQRHFPELVDGAHREFVFRRNADCQCLSAPHTVLVNVGLHLNPKGPVPLCVVRYQDEWVAHLPTPIMNVGYFNPASDERAVLNKVWLIRGLHLKLNPAIFNFPTIEREMKHQCIGAVFWLRSE